MKKLALTVGLSIILSSSLVVSNEHINAKAETIKIDKKFAKNLKKGKLPDSKGSVGMTYKKVKKLESKRGYRLIDGIVYQRDSGEENPVYYFELAKNGYPTKSDKVTRIDKIYPSASFKKSDVIKSLGKPKSSSGTGSNFEAKYKYEDYTVNITSTKGYSYGYIIENSVIKITASVSFKDVLDTLF